MVRPTKRPHLIAAAMTVAARDGIAALTLDAVAAEADVSKGGLLYHFPTKNALIAAVAADVVTRFAIGIEERVAADNRPAALAHAYVDSTFDDDASHPELLHALLAHPGIGPEQIGTALELIDVWEQRLVAAGLDAGTAALVRHACDGWWMTERLGAPRSTTAHAATVLRARLHRLIEEATS
ncbi:MAG TPA: TetR/AcrR family transcriptional regulator [Candidatus Stackebrandtia excrementipullorum]|nr:TetR/AcrR family transcriptional regulator [Candidatus Stackebrandtia excrementipullorum]